MKIILSGVETENKGAELMLYAILQELERSHPDAEVFVSHDMLRQGIDYVKTTIKMRYIEQKKIVRWCKLLKVTSVLNMLGIRSGFLNGYCPVDGAEYYIDGSGLLLTDQRIEHAGVPVWFHYCLRYMRSKGVKIVFLPQVFGPMRREWTVKSIKALGDYADLVYARENVSYGNLLSVVKNESKLRMATDFTSLVEGTVPSEYSHLSGKVCIIPNVQMVSMRVTTKMDYFWTIHAIIHTCAENGYECYLLNHEGTKDERLIEEYRQAYDDGIEVVSGLNALEIKGLISTAYLVVSSRFHGVVSALNTQVPCLATSWNHKYVELYKDYGIESGVLPLDDMKAMCAQVADALRKEKREEIRSRLAEAKDGVMRQTKEMWSEIWSIER